MAKRKDMTATPVAPAPGEAVVIAREGPEPSPVEAAAIPPVPDKSKRRKKRDKTPHHGVEPKEGAGEPVNPGSSPTPPPPEVPSLVSEAGNEQAEAGPTAEVGHVQSGESEGRGEESAVPASLPEGAQDQQGSPPKAVAIGRPSIFTEELAATICTRLSSGESLRSICRDDAMPAINTVMGWVFRNSEFMTQYRAAREMQAELMADEMQDIADDGSNDWMERHNSKGQFVGWMENGEAIKRSALRINTRQWIAARLLPKRWGDKSQVTHQNPDGTPVGQPIDPRTLSPEQREALGDALRAAMRQGAVDAEYEAEDAQ